MLENELFEVSARKEGKGIIQILNVKYFSDLSEAKKYAADIRNDGKYDGCIVAIDLVVE